MEAREIFKDIMNGARIRRARSYVCTYCTYMYRMIQEKRNVRKWREMGAKRYREIVEGCSKDDRRLAEGRMKKSDLAK